MKEYEEQLNELFVGTFHKVLAWEERELQNMGCKNLTVKELHVLDAIDRLKRQNQHTMSRIAKEMDISVGALTTAMNTLVKKGFVERGYRENDRRIVLVSLTENGEQANKLHEHYHQAMIVDLSESLTEEELKTLVQSLDKMANFLRKKGMKLDDSNYNR